MNYKILIKDNDNYVNFKFKNEVGLNSRWYSDLNSLIVNETGTTIDYEYKIINQSGATTTQTVGFDIYDEFENVYYNTIDLVFSAQSETAVLSSLVTQKDLGSTYTDGELSSSSMTVSYSALTSSIKIEGDNDGSFWLSGDDGISYYNGILPLSQIETGTTNSFRMRIKRKFVHTLGLTTQTLTFRSGNVSFDIDVTSEFIEYNSNAQNSLLKGEGLYSVVGRNDINPNQASADYSVSFGSGNIIESGATNSAIIGGTNTILSATAINTVVIGGEGGVYVATNKVIIPSGTTLIVDEPITGPGALWENYNVEAVPGVAATYVGIPTGCATSVTITADNIGVGGNSILIDNYSGRITIAFGITIWNTAHPTNTATLTSGDGTQIPENTAIIQLSGGVDAIAAASSTGVQVIEGGSKAIGDYSLASGENNSASGTSSAIVGGKDNSIEPLNFYSGIFVGKDNTITNAGGAYENVIVGGNSNLIASPATNSAIIGGNNNTNTGSYSTIAAGYDCNIQGGVTNFVAGKGSTIRGENSAILGGESNEVNAELAVIIGGFASTLNGSSSVILGGYRITVDGEQSVAGGGGNPTLDLKCSGNYSFNFSQQDSTTVQYDNAGDYSAILGGVNNNITSAATKSAIIGGSGQTLTTASTVMMPKIELSEDGAGIIMISSGGTKYNLTVDDSGNLVTTAV